jgi:hypothetical protein
MEPNRFGRKLGIGVRVASRMVNERSAQAVPPTQSPKGSPAAADLAECLCGTAHRRLYRGRVHQHGRNRCPTSRF